MPFGPRIEAERQFGPPQRNGQQAPPIPAQAGPCPSGYHLNKSSYYRRGPGGQAVFIPEGTVYVKNRRRNPANPRALDRALGRLNAAKRLQNKLSGYSTAKYTASGRKKKC